MLETLLQQTYFNNQVKDYLIFTSLLTGYVFLIQASKYVVIGRLKALAARTVTTIDDFVIRHIEASLLPLLYFIALYASLRILTLPPYASRLITVAGMALGAFFGVRFLIAGLDYFLQTRWIKEGDAASRVRSLKGIVTVLKVVIAGVAVLVFLDNVGIKVSTLVAGLGIGGVAVALASQTVLGDLFNYFVILFDRPFEHGDFIIVGEHLGTVEAIGIKTTRIRSLSGEQLILSNTYLAGSQVRNYKRMERRRVVFRLGVTYQTTHAQLQAIPAVIAGVIKSMPDTVFDRAHFSAYGDFALMFEVVYYVAGSDYNKYMDIQQAINLKVKEEFEKQGIEFAYPTQTLFVVKQ